MIRRTTLLAALPAIATAADVELVHQGRLVDAQGTPVSGASSVEVSLWSHATSTDAGTHRRYSRAYAVDLQDGYYSVVLGEGGGLASTALQGDVWIQVAIGGTPLLPRTPLRDVPGAVDVSAFDGVLRACPTGGFQAYDADNGTWSACPTSWDCTVDPTHSGCTATTSYTTCQAIRNDTTFGGTDGTYYIDPDGVGTGLASFPVYCDFDPSFGWTRLGVFSGTSDESISHQQAQTIPFTKARLSLNGTSDVVVIDCYAVPTTNGLQTTSTDKRCTTTDWYVRFDTASVSATGNYGFYRGGVIANDGGCNWATTTWIYGRGYHPSLGNCTALGLGEQYQAVTAQWTVNQMWMLVR